MDTLPHKGWRIRRVGEFKAAGDMEPSGFGGAWEPIDEHRVGQRCLSARDWLPNGDIVACPRKRRKNSKPA